MGRCHGSRHANSRRGGYVAFFFFQAEDGIRDYKVTGVQTCALPILLARIEVMLRRGGGTAVETKLRVADLEMDLLARAVTRAGQEIDLQPREFLLDRKSVV